MRNRLLSLVRRAPFLFLLAGLMIAPAGFGQNRPDGDGKADFSLTPEAGPWMIIVTSYTGPESEKFARDLCSEIRNRYKLRAYTFNWGAERRREQDEELRQKKEAQLKWFQDRGTPLDQPLRLKKVRIDEEHAVLVGGFKDMETARKELDRIKKLDKPNSVPASSIVNYFGGDDKNKKKDSKTEVNPFQQSFVGRNLAIKSREPAGTVGGEPEKADPFLKELNAHETYSVFQAKKPWTLVVKEFYGNTVIQPQSAPEGLMQKLFGQKKRSMLEAGAHDAREIARGLRAMNIEAYVMHTRYGSIVTVGSYDSQNDPKLLQNQKAFHGLKLGQGVELAVSPLPMKIPEL